MKKVFRGRASSRLWLQRNRIKLRQQKLLVPMKSFNWRQPKMEVDKDLSYPTSYSIFLLSIESYRLNNCATNLIETLSSFNNCRWLKNLMVTKRDSSVRRLAFISSVKAGVCVKSRWFERVKANSHHNSVPSLELAIQITICNSWTWTTGSSIAPPKLYSSPTVTSESTLCWA